MSVITRSWLAFAAIGAGVIHLALVVGSPLPIAAVLLLAGLAELTWAVLILVKDRMITPRLAQAGAVAPLILWSLLTVAATLLAAPGITSSVRVLPLGIAAIFELFVAVVLSVHLRHLADPDRRPRVRTASAGRYLLAVAVAGLVIGGLTTPALAATGAGAVAAEHGGTMGGMMDMHH